MPPLGTPRPLELPSITQQVLPNGLKIVLLEDHRQPALWMRLAVPAGSVRDPHDKVGLAQMTAGLLDKGTTSRSEAQIADLIDGLGASLAAGAGDDFITVSAQGLSPYAGTLFSLVADVTLHPIFPQEELDRARTRTLNEVTSALSQPGTLMAAALNRVIYGAYPYGDFSSGLPKTLATITRDDVKRFHDTLFVPTGSTLFLVGDITPAQATAMTTAAFGAWAGSEVAPPPSVPAPVAVSSERPQITLIDRPGSEQTQIGIGLLAGPYRDPNRIVGNVATAILGNGEFENRLMQEIRVKRGLTYGVGSGFARHAQAGAFEISTFTKNASTGEVVKLALGEANKMAQESVGAEELASHKTYLNGAFALSVATPDGLLARLESAVLFGEGPSDLTAYTDRTSAVTADQIRALMQDLGLGHAHIVLVGDAKAIGDQVKPLGDVTIIPVDSVDLQAPDLRSETVAKPAPTSSTEAGKARLAAAVQAFGGDAFLNLKTLRVKGKGELTPPGGQTPTAVTVEALTITVAAPDQSRVDLTTGLGEVALAFPGQGAAPWFRLNGSVRDAPRAFAALAELVNPTKLLRDAARKGYVVTDLPNSADPKPAGASDSNGLVGFAITDDAGRTTQVYVSSDTNLVRRMVVPGGANDVVVTLGDYHAADGVQVPGSLRIDRGKAMMVNFTFDTFTVNPTVEPTLFVRP
jgi:zinc protease